MRNVKTLDLITVMGILNKAEVKQNLVKLDVPKGLSDQQYGVLLILTIMEGVPSAKDELMGFLADVAEVEKEELENDEFEILPKLVEHLRKQDKFVDFLSNSFKSIK